MSGTSSSVEQEKNHGSYFIYNASCVPLYFLYLINLRLQNVTKNQPHIYSIYCICGWLCKKQRANINGLFVISSTMWPLNHDCLLDCAKKILIKSKVIYFIRLNICVVYRCHSKKVMGSNLTWAFTVYKMSISTSRHSTKRCVYLNGCKNFCQFIFAQWWAADLSGMYSAFIHSCWDVLQCTVTLNWTQHYWRWISEQTTMHNSHSPQKRATQSSPVEEKPLISPRRNNVQFCLNYTIMTIIWGTLCNNILYMSISRALNLAFYICVSNKM